MLSIFPRNVLDGILDLIGSVSEGFPTCSSTSLIMDSSFQHRGPTIKAIPRT